MPRARVPPFPPALVASFLAATAVGGYLYYHGHASAGHAPGALEASSMPVVHAASWGVGPFLALAVVGAASCLVAVLAVGRPGGR